MNTAALKESGMTVINRPIAAPVYLGNALELDETQWIARNEILLVERFRVLTDNCLILDLDPPDYNEFPLYASAQYETERAKLQRLAVTP